MDRPVHEMITMGQVYPISTKERKNVDNKKLKLALRTIGFGAFMLLVARPAAMPMTTHAAASNDAPTIYPPASVFVLPHKLTSGVAQFGTTSSYYGLKEYDASFGPYFVSITVYKSNHEAMTSFNDFLSHDNVSIVNLSPSEKMSDGKGICLDQRIGAIACVTTITVFRNVVIDISVSGGAYSAHNIAIVRQKLGQVQALNSYLLSRAQAYADHQISVAPFYTPPTVAQTDWAATNPQRYTLPKSLVGGAVTEGTTHNDDGSLTYDFRAEDIFHHAESPLEYGWLAYKITVREPSSSTAVNDSIADERMAEVPMLGGMIQTYHDGVLWAVTETAVNSYSGEIGYCRAVLGFPWHREEVTLYVIDNHHNDCSWIPPYMNRAAKTLAGLLP